MTVAQLALMLHKMNPNAKVYFYNQELDEDLIIDKDKTVQNESRAVFTVKLDR